MKMKDQSVKLLAEDVPHLKKIKREMKNLPTARAVGAALRGWRFLNAEQKLAAMSDQPEPVASSS